MPRIVHLSDVHLQDGAGADEQKHIFSSMHVALKKAATEPHDGKTGVDLLVITGDLFNSSRLPEREALEMFEAWYAGVTSALGDPHIRAVILPGNHDVRDTGVIGPHSTALFQALKKSFADQKNVTVHGCDVPFLTARLPPEAHGLPAEVVLIDSTYLATGEFSAGGVLRQEDLLEVISQIPASPEVPVIVLLHHHLIPTPITDVGAIDVHGQSMVKTLLVTKVLPKLFANADHEELSMTALGAGTTLTTLHNLDRAVLVLHGHKHYPTVRVLRGVYAEHGDLLLSAAGSAGLAESWRPTKHPKEARLWPSFNVVDFDGSKLSIASMAYPPTPGKPVGRLLLKAHAEQSAWTIDERGDSQAPGGHGPRLGRNRAVYHLENAGPDRALWDARVERTVTGALHDPYEEVVDGAPKAYLDEVEALEEPSSGDCPTNLVLRVGGENRYRLVGGLCGTLKEAFKDYGERTAPYEWIDLLNRYASDLAELVLRGFPAGMGVPFGGATDLTSGVERPLALRREGHDYVLTVKDCPPRTLLRIFWRLAGD